MPQNTPQMSSQSTLQMLKVVQGHRQTSLVLRIMDIQRLS